MAMLDASQGFCIDLNERGFRSRPTIPTEAKDQYRQIGEHLLICEAANARIGIPWLFPTPRVRALRSQMNPPLDEFVRTSLVTVSTNILDSYVEDLENLPCDRESASYLSISYPRAVERYALACLLGVAAAVAVAAAGTYAELQPTLLVSVTALAALLVTGFFGYLSSEKCRRGSFYWLLFQELMRRRGLDKDDLTPLPLYKVGEPVSE